MTRALVDVFAVAGVLLLLFFGLAAVLTFLHARRRGERQKDLATYMSHALARDEQFEDEGKARARLGAITMGDLVREPALYAAALRAVRNPGAAPPENPPH